MKLMPQEIEVWYIIPCIRREFAKILKSKGISQKEIAQILGITESAVSQYLHEKRAYGITFTKELLDLVEEAAERIIENPSKVVDEIQRVVNATRKTRLVCEVHKKYDSAELSKCDICFR